MTIWKKAISVGTSAALLASLLITAVAPAALASVTVTSVGSIPVGGTSASELTLLFTERSKAGAACPVQSPPDPDLLGLNNAAGQLVFTINDVNGGDVTFSGTAVKSAPGSLGTVTATASGNALTISWTASDCANVETIQITGLKIAAAATAMPGPVNAVLTGDFAAFFVAPTTATATGVIQDSNTLAAGADAADILVSSVCSFAVTGAPATTANAFFSDLSDGRAVTAAPAPVAGLQTVTFAAGTAAHPAGTTVTQVVNYVAACPAGALVGAVGVIGDSLIYNAPGGQTRLNPAENNQFVDFNLSATERTAGFLKVDATITLTIATAGVTFSQAPRVSDNSDLVLFGVSGTNTSYGVLSADRKSATWTVTTASTSPSTITFYNLYYDVASTVAVGTKVDVTLATSAGAVVPTSRSNAVVGRVLTATSTSPVVYIGENNQTAGQVTVAEVGPGFFQAGAGSNNTLAICLTYNTFENEQFASAPWAKVTAGDLKLREGNVASSDNVVQGTAFYSSGYPFACYYWTIWSASTAASTIVLSGDEAGTMGVKINVPAGSPTGPVTASIRTGDISSGTFSMMLEVRAQIAVRQFRNQVAVTALSQPTIPVGSNGSAVGDIQIQETANGQLKFNERICVEIVPNQNWNSLFDAFLTGMNTANVPVVTASNGILVNAVSMSANGCQGENRISGTLVESFSFYVTQQSVTGNGKLVISNIKYATVNDAVEGPVMVNVYGFGLSNTIIDFQALISNARIGVKPAITIGSATALGTTMIGPFTTPTKTAALNHRITWRFSGGSALAGKRVQIWVATRNADGSWGAWSRLTGRTADGAGNAFFWTKYDSAKRISVRAFFPGDATYRASWSPSGRQGVWR